jgi:hypothetical protein
LCGCRVRFGDNFDFRLGGKLMGLCSGNCKDGCNKGSAIGASIRAMWGEYVSEPSPPLSQKTPSVVCMSAQ